MEDKSKRKNFKKEIKKDSAIKKDVAVKNESNIQSKDNNINNNKEEIILDRNENFFREYIMRNKSNLNSQQITEKNLELQKQSKVGKITKRKMLKIDHKSKRRQTMLPKSITNDNPQQKRKRGKSMLPIYQNLCVIKPKQQKAQKNQNENIVNLNNWDNFMGEILSEESSGFKIDSQSIKKLEAIEKKEINSVNLHNNQKVLNDHKNQKSIHKVIFLKYNYLILFRLRVTLKSLKKNRI